LQSFITSFFKIADKRHKFLPSLPNKYSTVVSKGSADATLVEFKLASNSRLKRNLMNQVKIYQGANSFSKSIQVILYFSLDELQGVKLILKELKLLDDETIVLIDARRDNKK
jgi:hypothetical protein